MFCGRRLGFLVLSVFAGNALGGALDDVVVPAIDLDADSDRQVVVAKKDDQYYGHWKKSKPAYIVSVRFTLTELDALMAKTVD